VYGGAGPSGYPPDTNGGGIISSVGPVIVDSADIINTTCIATGGAIEALSSLVLNSCLFRHSSSTGGGGGIYVAGIVKLNDTTFDSCNTVGFGGSVYVSKSSGGMNFVNCVFKNCSSTSGGGAIYLDLEAVTWLRFMQTVLFIGNNGSGLGNDVFDAKGISTGTSSTWSSSILINVCSRNTSAPKFQVGDGTVDVLLENSCQINIIMVSVEDETAIADASKCGKNNQPFCKYIYIYINQKSCYLHVFIF
jgi:predicted outer membrane repeat protein